MRLREWLREGRRVSYLVVEIVFYFLEFMRVLSGAALASLDVPFLC